tara:strand:+ start:197 stop:361 length:165 start_codon:yes stop_codon:yes gene_type:complete
MVKSKREKAHERAKKILARTKKRHGNKEEERGLGGGRASKKCRAWNWEKCMLWK